MHDPRRTRSIHGPDERGMDNFFFLPLASGFSSRWRNRRAYETRGEAPRVVVVVVVIQQDQLDFERREVNSAGANWGCSTVESGTPRLSAQIFQVQASRRAALCKQPPAPIQIQF